MYKEIIFISIIVILGFILYSFLANQPTKENFTSNDNSSSSENLMSQIFPTNNNLASYTGVINKTNFDNYNHFTGSTSNLNPGSYYEPNGGLIKVTSNGDGSVSIEETIPDSVLKNIYSNSSNPSLFANSTSSSSNSKSTFYGSNGGTATSITLNNGQQAIKVTDKDGNTLLYSQSPTSATNDLTSMQYFGSTGTTIIPSNYNNAYSSGNNATSSSKTIFTGPNGTTAMVNSNTSITVTQNGSTSNFTSQSGSPNKFTNSNGDTLTLTRQNNGIVLVLSESDGSTETLTNSFFSGSSSTNNNSSNSTSSSTSSSSDKTTFFGPGGATAIVNSNTSITLIQNGNSSNFTSQSGSPTVFNNSNGETLTVSKKNNGMVLILTETDGSTQTFTNPFFSGSGNNSTNPFNFSISNPSSNSTDPFTNNSSNSSNTNSNSSPYYATSNNYNNNSYPGQSNSLNPYQSSNSNQNSYGGNQSYNTNQYGGSQNYNTNSSSNPYSSSLPPGIPRSQIPNGEENLYILKSEIVPPVCPACPSTTVCPTGKKDKPPPCPPCARCPEPNFTCKKVPNYGASDYSAAYYGSSGGYDDLDSDYNSNNDNNRPLPEPVVSSFSTFGM